MITTKSLDRRRALALLGGAGASTFLAHISARTAAAATCSATPALTEGPYFVEENLNRSDIRVDPSTGAISPGVLLALKITVSLTNNAGCGVLPGARVEIWHCDAAGVYSDETANNSKGRKFLRGYQITDENGVANFTTIYPGWYQGRAVHVHLKVRTYSGSTILDEFTSQFFFDENVTSAVHAAAPYNTRGQRDTRNTTDGIFRGAQNSDRIMIALTKTDLGYAGTFDIGVNLKTPAVAKAVITSSGVVNAGSYQSGVAPGAWITIFGQNFANSARAVATSDLVNANLPTTLNGVSVKINGRDAFIQYVSPTQINVQAPEDGNTGIVQVTVSNSAGTSDPVTATMQSVFPAFFVSQSYVAAVRSDGVIVTGVPSTADGTVQAVKPGDVVSLFGNGFGPTDPAVPPGKVLQTQVPITNAVTITIGGVEASWSFAGLSSTGLYQFNVTVPNTGNGDQAVLARIAGQTTQPGVYLRVQNP